MSQLCSETLSAESDITVNNWIGTFTKSMALTSFLRKRKDSFLQGSSFLQKRFHTSCNLRFLFDLLSVQIPSSSSMPILVLDFVSKEYFLSSGQTQCSSSENTEKYYRPSALMLSWR